jgi:hypothetical protein
METLKNLTITHLTELNGLKKPPTGCDLLYIVVATILDFEYESIS